MSKAAAQALTQVIVISTIQCMVNGESTTFLPSKKPQGLPASDAKEAIERGLAKLPQADDEDEDEDTGDDGEGQVNV